MTLAAASYTWYVARAGGILAFLLLSATVVAGLLLSGRARLEGWPRFAVEDVHRFLGLLAGAFVAVHLAALLVDSYLPFSLTNLVVPGTAPYRPLAVALGVVAAELLAALAIANHYWKALSYRFWRRTHYLKLRPVGAGAVPELGRGSRGAHGAPGPSLCAGCLGGHGGARRGGARGRARARAAAPPRARLTPPPRPPGQEMGACLP